MPVCEKCHKESPNLVKVCTELEAIPSPENRIYPDQAGYRKVCRNCAHPDAEWQSTTGYCSECIPPTIRVGHLCPTCAGKVKYFCCNCQKRVEHLLPSLRCVGCDASQGFQASSVFPPTMNKCTECGNRATVNSSGMCKNCFKEKNVEKFYLSHGYLAKCRTCDDPQYSIKGYCISCANELDDCIECRAPVPKWKLACNLHARTCKGCGESFEISNDVRQIACNECLKKSQRFKICSGCGEGISKEDHLASTGFCGTCYESAVNSEICRRCDTTEGYVICPTCEPKRFLCKRCHKEKVPSDEYVCGNCASVLI